MTVITYKAIYDALYDDTDCELSFDEAQTILAQVEILLLIDTPEIQDNAAIQKYLIYVRDHLSFILPEIREQGSVHYFECAPEIAGITPRSEKDTLSTIATVFHTLLPFSGNLTARSHLLKIDDPLSMKLNFGYAMFIDVFKLSAPVVWFLSAEELVAALAHEFGHKIMGHYLDPQTHESEQQQDDADLMGAVLLVQSGRSVEDMMSMLEKIRIFEINTAPSMGINSSDLDKGIERRVANLRKRRSDIEAYVAATHLAQEQLNHSDVTSAEVTLSQRLQLFGNESPQNQDPQTYLLLGRLNFLKSFGPPNRIENITFEEGYWQAGLAFVDEKDTTKKTEVDLESLKRADLYYSYTVGCDALVKEHYMNFVFNGENYQTVFRDNRDAVVKQVVEAALCRLCAFIAAYKTSEMEKSEFKARLLTLEDELKFFQNQFDDRSTDSGFRLATLVAKTHEWYESV